MKTIIITDANNNLHLVSLENLLEVNSEIIDVNAVLYFYYGWDQLVVFEVEKSTVLGWLLKIQEITKETE